MQDKPNPNPDAPKREIPPMPSQVSGDNIIIMGDVRSGSVGSGSMTANNIAGGDIVINNGTVGADSSQDFADLLAQLKDMLVQAQAKGELDEPTAQKAISQLDSAQKLVKEEKKPPKPQLIQKLEAVAQIIDSAVDSVTQDGSVAMILIKALPIAVMLVRLATKLF